jgi:hypothetical protein
MIQITKFRKKIFHPHNPDNRAIGFFDESKDGLEGVDWHYEYQLRYRYAANSRPPFPFTSYFEPAPKEWIWSEWIDVEVIDENGIS